MAPLLIGLNTSPPSCSFAFMPLHSMYMNGHLGSQFLLYPEDRHWPFIAPAWTLHSIAGVESHLVHSRSPTAQPGVPATAAFQPFIWPGGCSVAYSGLHRMTESANLRCCLGGHSATRHSLDKKGLAPRPPRSAPLLRLHCVLLWQQASFTTSRQFMG